MISTAYIQHFQIFYYRWTVPDSNRSPPHCKCGALPNELTARNEQLFIALYTGHIQTSFMNDREVALPMTSRKRYRVFKKFCDG